MSTNQTRNTTTTTPENGTAAKPKQTRTRKPLNARTAAVKIAETLEKLPHEQREKAFALAKALADAGA